MFEKRNIKDILGVVGKSHRKQLQEALQALVVKIEKSKPKEKSVQQILSECKISQQLHEKYASDLEKGNFAFMLALD